MDKNTFVQWICEKINIIMATATDEQLENKEAKAYLQGAITVMEEIKAQVESGKFDK